MDNFRNDKEFYLLRMILECLYDKGNKLCITGAKTVPRNHSNKNSPNKINEDMQISAIKSIENISKNAIHIA